MTIADEKLKSASERHMLFKVSPKKYIGNDLVLDSGIIYSMPQVEPIESIKGNGVIFNKVFSAPNSNEYFHDEENNILYLAMFSPANEETNVVIAEFNLFFTGETTRYITEDPLDPGTTIREWQPKVITYPSVSESIKDITNGVFSISSLSLKLIDTDLYLKSLMNLDQTFYNSDVTVWNVINSVTEKVYLGKISKVTPATDSISFSILDSFSSLNTLATNGDSDSEIYARKATYPNLFQGHVNRVIPFFYGATSYSKISFGGWAGQSLGVVNAAVNGISGGNEAILTDANEYILGRVGPSGVADQDVGTITAVGGDAGGLSGAETTMTFVTTGHNMRVGDTFNVDSLDTVITYYCGVFESTPTGFVCKVFTASGNDWFTENGGIGFDDFIAHPVTSSSSFDLGKSVQIRSETSDGLSKPIGMNRLADFVIETSTTNGNKLIKIDLTKLSAPTGTIDLDNGDRLYFTLTPEDDASHEIVVKDIIESSGLTTNAASFTQAGTDLDIDCLFQIPFAGSSSFPPYTKVIEKIMQSVLGFVFVDENLEVNYVVAKAPVSGDSIDDDICISGRSRVRVEYQDIITGIIAKNKHYNSVASEIESIGPDFISTNSKSKYLNVFENIESFDHVLRSVGTRLQDILDLRSKRQVTYEFEVATELIDANLTDDKTLSGLILIGGVSTENVKIVSLKKSPGKITAKATDLKGL